VVRVSCYVIRARHAGQPLSTRLYVCVFLFQAEYGIRDSSVTGVQTCALPILSNTSHPLWRCQRAPAEGFKPSEQSAEGVPLSDTCQSPHTPCGGSHELQLLRVRPVNSTLNVCFARAQCCSDMGLNGSFGHSLLRERPSESALCSGTRKAAPTPSGAQR